MDLSKKERQQLRLEKLRRESQEAQKEFEADQQHAKNLDGMKTSSPIKKYLIIGSIAFILLVSGYFAAASFGTGQYDDFAKCLTEKNAVVYGNDFCGYTQKQIGWFGKSKKYLNYVRCTDNKALCDSKGVKVTPTWEIEGNMYPEVQTFERLSSITGCEIFNKKQGE